MTSLTWKLPGQIASLCSLASPQKNFKGDIWNHGTGSSLRWCGGQSLVPGAEDSSLLWSVPRSPPELSGAGLVRKNRGKHSKATPSSPLKHVQQYSQGACCTDSSCYQCWPQRRIKKWHLWKKVKRKRYSGWSGEVISTNILFSLLIDPRENNLVKKEMCCKGEGKANHGAKYKLGTLKWPMSNKYILWVKYTTEKG